MDKSKTCGVPLTVEQKRIFLRDILYVLRQAQAFREVMRLGGIGVLMHGHPLSLTVHNAVLESSLGFLRKINEFFGRGKDWKKKGPNDDAGVRVFFPDFPSDYLWDTKELKLLNDRVMHLSLCHAIDGKDYDWEAFLNTHLPEAERRFEVFLKRLRSEHPELFANNAADSQP